MPNPPLDEQRIAAYVRGALTASERIAVERALDENPEWLAVVAVLARGAGGSEGGDDERVTGGVPAPGTRVGRYALGTVLGRGASGVVMAAWDPELRRDVALKLVDPSLLDDPVRAQARLSREAKALARVEDPHVVAVYDVGTWHGRVFVAMERLDGGTLAAWRQAAGRSWREVLARWIDAGDGLAAAHRHGLIHRDFKPTNVMLDGHGRVVVVDFGLAREVGASLDQDDGSVSPPPLEPGSRWHTRTGVAVGTPAYMAPEQRGGKAVTPAADQYALCVSLHEALSGTLPDGSPRAEVPPLCDVVPRRVWRLVERGRAQQVDDRFEDLGDLLRGLRACLAPPRVSARMWVGTGVLGLAAVAWWASDGGRPAQEASPLRADAANDVSAPALDPTGTAQAAALHEALQALEDRRHQGQYDALPAEASALVDRADALGDALLRAKTRLVLGMALEGAAEFERAAAVYDQGVEIAMAAQLDGFATRLLTQAAWVAAQWQRDPVQGRTLIEHAAAWSKRAHNEPSVESDRLRVLGHVEIAAGNLQAAGAAFQAAYQLASTLPKDDPEGLELQIVTDADWGSLLVSRNKLDEARPHFERAAALQARRVGDAHPSVAEMNNNVAALLRGTGQYERARVIFERNLEIFSDAYGKDNPRVGSTLVNLAVVELDLGRGPAALEHAIAAVRALEAAHGSESAVVAQAISVRAQAETFTDQPERALRSLQDARALMAAQLGEAHAEVGVVDSDIGHALLDLDRAAEARVVFERALVTLHAAWGSSDSRLTLVYQALSSAHAEQGDATAAIVAIDAALAVADPTNEAGARAAKGALLLQGGHPEDALVYLERAVALRDSNEGDPQVAMADRLLLARALRAAGKQPARARALGQAVLEQAVALQVDAIADEARAFVGG